MSSKKFYAVLPIKYTLTQKEVIMLATTKADSLNLYINWNGGGFDVTPEFLKENELEIREVNVGKQ